MKFTLNELIEKLKTKLTNGGKKPLRISERTLSEQSDDLMNLMGDDEIELDAFVEKIYATLDRMNSNVGNDVSNHAKKIEEELKKKYAANAEPAPKQEKTEPGTPKPTSEIDELKSQLAVLIAEREEEKRGREIGDKKAQIKKHLKEKNVADDKWIEGAISIMKIDADTNVEETGEALLKLFNSQHSNPSHYSPSPAGGGNGTNENAFSDVVEKLKRQRGE